MFGLTYALVFAITLACGLGVVFARRADHAAFCLMGAMFGIAANFLLMGQEMLAFIQIIVYVGAIMVLFLFVIMLLNLREPEGRLLESVTPTKAACFGASFLALALLWIFILNDSTKIALPDAPTGRFDPHGAKAVAVSLFTRWVYPVELIALLLLAAVIGAVVIARRRPILHIETDGQAAARFAASSASAEPAIESPAPQAADSH
jgi:NADH-quinone oxidoreductase subunit J